MHVEVMDRKPLQIWPGDQTRHAHDSHIQENSVVADTPSLVSQPLSFASSDTPPASLTLPFSCAIVTRNGPASPGSERTVTNLQKVTITFNTTDDDKGDDTILHVFVKNRSSTSSTPESATDFISNLLSYQSHNAADPWDINPYLGFGQSLAEGQSFDNNSSATFDIPLRPSSIPLEEIELPVVNVHILPDGSDRWIFDYTITFLFDDGRSFSSSSNTDGVTGIILDQDNRNYSGICTENPFYTPSPPPKPETDAVLARVDLAFYTHNDNKNSDTQLNVHIVNRLNATSSQDIAIGLDLYSGQEFPEKSTMSVAFPSAGLPLASDAVRLQDIVLPQVFINIVQQGSDRWIFDYRISFTFSNGQRFTSQTNGITLDQDRHKYQGVYQGAPFPTVTPPSQAPVNVRDHRISTKVISLSYLQSKLDEFINNRQGVGGQEPPIRKLRLDNEGVFGNPLPQSYYDLQALVADPPPPGTLSSPGSQEGTTYNSNPKSLGQLSGVLSIGDRYFENMVSKTLTARIDPTQPVPITVEVDFDLPQPGSGINGWDVTSFLLRIGLTLELDQQKGLVDLLGWVPGITDDDQIEQYLAVQVTTAGSTDLGGSFQSHARPKILSTLTDKDPFDGKTLRDRLNETATSWLLGGASEGPGVCTVQDVQINGDNLEITYTGPQGSFMPLAPANWPAGTDFSPGTLANIDHIVVLTMENHSFDSMLGYLSLPPEKGGMGRTEVDGLKGTESNALNGTSYPCFAFAPGDTIFAPDPPHGYEPVHRAINGGAMDGFVRSYAEGNGPAVAPRIMGYYNAANVPMYDALARDFAIGHRWFASHPGPTFCNRFYELTGRLNVDAQGFWEFDNSSPLRAVFTPTIFDYLTGRGVSWKHFESHYCFLRFFQAHTFDTESVTDFDHPEFGFVNLARNGALPSVSFIDPHFIELPPNGNCDGPPADIQAGQQLVQKVVDAVVSSPAWNKTLLLIVYDEHGGFFDHVPPPSATKVTPDSLDTYGVRVPAFVISPWVNAGAVFGHDGLVVGGDDGGAKTGGAQTNRNAEAARVAPLRSLHFDHTSILKTIARRFMSENPPYMGARYAAANDLSAVLGNELRQSQFLPFIPYNVVYGASQKRLDVRGASTAPGTFLWQYNPNDTIAQQFSFEDAGDGSFYIRTHTGSLYLTADDSLGVKQDVKYPAGIDAASAHNRDRQRWTLTSSGVALSSSGFTVWNAAFPGKVLQASGGSTDSGVAVVLGDPQVSHIGVIHNPNPWQVTSPLLPSGNAVLHQ